MATIGQLNEAVNSAQVFIESLKRKDLSDDDIARLLIGSSIGVLVQNNELDYAEQMAKQFVIDNAATRREHKNLSKD